jgi:hypothetical protein
MQGCVPTSSHSGHVRFRSACRRPPKPPSHNETTRCCPSLVTTSQPSQASEYSVNTYYSEFELVSHHQPSASIGSLVSRKHESKSSIKHKPTNDREPPTSIHPFIRSALLSTPKSCVCEPRAEPLATAAAAAARQTMEPAFLAFAAARDLSSSIAAFDVLQQHTSKTDISEGPVAGSITLLNELSRVVLPTGADLYNALGPRLEQASSRG